MIGVDLDIADAYITDPGMAVIDPCGSFAAVLPANDAQNSAWLLTPGLTPLMLRPVQLTSAWPSRLKFRLADFHAGPRQWEEQQVRAAGDYWLHSLTGSVEPITLRYSFPANTGWFIELRAYTLPKAGTVNLIDVAFGGRFQLFVDSDGTVTLFDTTVSLTVPLGAGNIANGKSFAQSDVTLMILPYRRGRILIWSPSLGGSVDLKVNTTPPAGGAGTGPFVITDPGTVTLYSSTAPPAALVSVTPLMYPADGVAPLLSPPKALKAPLTAEPTVTPLFDSDYGSSLTVAAHSAYTSQPKLQYLYTVTAEGNPAHQSIAEQGVEQIAAATSTTSGSSVFDNVNGYVASLHTPFLYQTQIGYDRHLGAAQYTTNTLSGVLDVHLTFSKDRSQKSAVVVLDNPANAYTSVKDLQNRLCSIYLTTPAIEGLPSPAEPDPDTALCSGARLYLFFGFMDNVEFDDGVASRLRITLQGLRKRLKNYVFADQPNYDGWKQTDVMVDLLRRAGHSNGQAVDGFPSQIEVYSDTTTLPIAPPGAEPLFCPAIGSSAEQMIELLQNYTGWTLDDLIPPGYSRALWYWVPFGYLASSLYQAQGSPDVAQSSSFAHEFGITGLLSLPDAVQPNGGLQSLVALSDPPPRQTAEELIANNILVIGCDDDGNPLLAQYTDTKSVSDRTAVNYVGELRTYVLVSQTLNTPAAVASVCAKLAAVLPQARTQVEFVLPDYYPQLAIEAPVTVSGYWPGSIINIDADLSRLNVRETTVNVLRTYT